MLMNFDIDKGKIPQWTFKDISIQIKEYPISKLPRVFGRQNELIGMVPNLRNIIKVYISRVDIIKPNILIFKYINLLLALV